MMAKSTRRIPGRASVLEDRGGFTLIELLLIMVIISILAAMAQPNYHRATVKARAADALADMKVVEVAVQQYQAFNHSWPVDRNRGLIPPGLEEHLPDGFSFQKPDFTLDYDNWAGIADAPFTIGLSVVTDDADLARELLALLGSNAWADGASKVTWIISD